MTDENKKDAIDAEVVDASDSKEEKKEEPKKENGFSKLFNRAKTSINNAKLESAIEAEFKKGHTNTLTIYNKNEILSSSYYGTYTNEEKTEVIVYNKREARPYSILINETDNNAAYYITGSKETTVKLNVEGVDYERPATLIQLDKNVEEVNVIKAGRRFFIYKGEEK